MQYTFSIVQICMLYIKSVTPTGYNSSNIILYLIRFNKIKLHNRVMYVYVLYLCVHKTQISQTSMHPIGYVRRIHQSRC